MAIARTSSPKNTSSTNEDREGMQNVPAKIPGVNVTRNQRRTVYSAPREKETQRDGERGKADRHRNICRVHARGIMWKPVPFSRRKREPRTESQIQAEGAKYKKEVQQPPVEKLAYAIPSVAVDGVCCQHRCSPTVDELSRRRKRICNFLR